MAKRNSTKTATKEAMQNAVPRILSFSGWQGVDISNAQIDSSISEVESASPDIDSKRGQTDAKPNFLVAQSNLETCSSGAVATRRDLRLIANEPSADTRLIGIAHTHKNWIYAGCEKKSDGSPEMWRYNLETNEWQQITIDNKREEEEGDKDKKRTITDFIVFQSTLLVLMKVLVPDNDTEYEEQGEVYSGYLDNEDPFTISNCKVLPEPSSENDGFKVEPVNIDPGTVSRQRYTYVYCNKYGSTLERDVPVEVNLKMSPQNYQSSNYIRLSGVVPESLYDAETKEWLVDAIDIYVSIGDNQNYAYIGRSAIEDGSWAFNWLGAFMDSTQWTEGSITMPTQNTTGGVDAQYVDQYDGRLYFYGGQIKERLYIGGNPGNEQSVSTGLGGAFTDIEPGAGYEIRKVLKFKTYNGASTVTILCYHPNSNKSSRYNLIDTNLTLTNEYSSRGYDTEKVDSVTGCNSYFGADTFIDGLYSLTRYGLAVTTKQMENQNNLKVTYLSGPIEPIFTNLNATCVDEARLLCINDRIYFCFSDVETDRLSSIIFVYDTLLKSWYNYTLPNTLGFNNNIKHLFHIDNKTTDEGIGIIISSTEHAAGGIYLLPTTGEELLDKYEEHEDGYLYPIKPLTPDQEVYLETHELGLKNPPTNYQYVSQLEFHFDYICAPHGKGLDIWVEGIDLYGRTFNVHQNIFSKFIAHDQKAYIRVDRNVLTYKVHIKGRAIFKLNAFHSKVYQQSSSIGMAYGFDNTYRQRKQHGVHGYRNHKIKDYNSLKEIIMT